MMPVELKEEQAEGSDPDVEQWRTATPLYEYLDVLNELLWSVNQPKRLSADELQQAALDHFLRLVGAEQGAIGLYDPESNLVHMALSRQMPERFSEAARAGLPLNRFHFLHEAIRERQVIVRSVRDYPDRSFFKSLFERHGWQQMLLTPLLSHERLIGLLAALFPHEQLFPEPLLKGLTIAGQLIGIALENVRLFQQLQRSDAELQQTHERVIRQERLLALGQMASGIAHDFNNALMRIMGGIELIALEGGLTPKQENYMELVRTCVMDASNVVARLREFYRPVGDDDAFTSLQLNSLIEQVICLTQPRWKDVPQSRGKVINIRTELSTTLPIRGNPAELREVLTNLIFNAVDAMPDGGTLTFQTYQGNNTVVLEVRDTGLGMSEEVCKRCFEPFFTTKQANGSGLGLAVVYGILQRHHGTIEIQAEEGKGTRIVIQLPSIPAQTQAVVQLSEAKVPPLRILFVEDEETIRSSLSTWLQKDGHQVVTAQTPDEALRKMDKELFDLLLTDHGMPGMNGGDLAARLKSKDPNLHVILVTGWSDWENSTKAQIANVDLVLTKPLRRDVLRSAMAEVFYSHDKQ